VNGRRRHLPTVVGVVGVVVVVVVASLAGCAPDAMSPDAMSPDGMSPDAMSPVSIVSSDPPRPPVPPATTIPPATSPALVESGPVESGPSSATSITDARIVLVELARFERPVDLAARPGDDAVYVVQQSGTIVRWSVDDDVRTTALDVTDAISTGGEQGLLGVAFTPDGRHAFVNTTDRRGSTTITTYPVGSDGHLEAASSAVVLVVEQPHANHNAGDLAVDGDGLLYVALGDGGSAGDPGRFAHDPSSLLGSVLRVDPLLDGAGGYRIPDDNPFAGGTFRLPDGTAVVGAPEVFAWGLRNPWKFAFDPLTGDLWIPDVGQNEMEEINMVPSVDGRPAGRGHDFGWSAFEGTERFNTDIADTGHTTPPVLTYRHGPDGCSISGGEPYRGRALPALAGAYVYSDFCSGRLWALDLARSEQVLLAEGLTAVTAVRADADGELYVLEADGRILGVAPG
jgi:glucose/arabinose dehydrogenase